MKGLLLLLLLLLFTDCPTTTWFVYCFPLVGLLTLKDAILEVYLYQKEANIICHFPALSGYSLTAKSPWEAKRSFRYYCSKASQGFSAQLCLLTESRLGLAWVRWGCGDLSLLLPRPASLEHVLRELRSCKQVMFARCWRQRCCSVFAAIPFLVSWGMEAHVCMRS